MSSITVSGGTPFGGDPKEIVLEEAHKAMRAATLYLEAEYKRRVTRRTGHLQRSITSNTVRVGDRIFGDVGTNVIYAKYLEFGTGLYGPSRRRITPKTKQALRFPGQVGKGTPFTLAGRQRSGRAGRGANWVFAKSVAGVFPRSWMTEASHVVQGPVLGMFRAAGRSAAERIAAGG